MKNIRIYSLQQLKEVLREKQLKLLLDDDDK
jgi:hypothetical protein